MLQVLRHHAGLVVAFLALLTWIGTSIFNSVPKVEGAQVDAYSRFRDGPFLLASTASHNPYPNGTIKEVASLNVPTGLYVIFAKGFAKVANGAASKLDCTLSAEQDFDHVRVGLDATEDQHTHAKKTDEEAFALNVLHRFTAPGTISLKCSCDVDDVDLSFIKITALHVNSFLNTPQ